MPRVLIVEDEAVLRTSMARGLRKAASLEVDEAGSLDEAVVFLDASPPDLVLSDIDLPGRSGIEILGELGVRGLKVPVIFVSAYLKAYGAQIPRHADVEVREKPVGLEELRQLVARRVGPSGPAAEASPFSAADFVQLACLGRHSVVIEKRRGAALDGAIVVSSGEVWSARLAAERGPEGLDGVESLRRLLFEPGAVVTCRTLRGSPGERNVNGGWQELLLEAARIEDEDGQAPPEGRDPFDEAWEEGVAALLRKDYPAALGFFRRADSVRPGDRRVEANLTRLREMGVAEEGG